MTARAHPVDVQAVLRALAETRRADIVRLLEQRHRTQEGLCRDLDMAQPLLSHHLKVLRDVGLIDTTLCGRVNVYQLRADTLDALRERVIAMTENARAIAEHRPC